MAKQMGPRFKLARHLGVNVFGHPNALKRGVKVHKNLSEYGKQLLEKQKLKAYYGVLEKQFKIYVNKALKSKENTGDVLVQTLESRLDNLVYRLGFASTLRQGRQMVVHGHILVNGRKVDRPSYQVRVGDIISLSEKSRKIALFKDNFTNSLMTLNYLDKNIDDLSGTLTRLPERSEIPIEVTDSLVVEYYSKF